MQQTKKTDEKNIKTRQQINKGRSKRQSTWLIIQLLPLLSLCCLSAVNPLLLRCRTTTAPLSLRCCYAAVAPAVAMQSLLLSPPLSLRCCAVAAPLLLRYRFCPSVAAAVAPAAATVSLLISLLLSLTVVGSRGRIRVTAFIGDYQARVSSSSEGCSTSHKTVKVETY